MTVICGTDFSDNATMAARVAAAFAKRQGLPLIVAHAIDELGADLIFHSDERRVYDPLRAQLRELSDQLEATYSVAVDGQLLPGTPHAVLLDLARRSEGSLIVIGAVGADKPRWLLGNQAQLIAQASPVPVLIVRERTSVEDWFDKESPLQVMVGVEPTATAKAALRWARHLRELGPVELTMTRIVNSSAECRRLGLPASAGGELDPQVEAILSRDLHSWSGSEGDAASTQYVIVPSRGQRGDALAAVAAERHSALLVVGTHRRAGVTSLWLSSVSRAVIERAAMNVVVVPTGTLAERARVPAVRSALVPSDFSEDSSRAIAFACALLGPGDTVHLIHVAPEEGAVNEEALCERLEAQVPADAATLGLDTTAEVVRGASVADAVLHAARRHGATLICMAASKRSEAARVLLGSETAEVVRRSTRPVVLVPPAE
ncbi:MAG: universal stress protein [Acidobacteriota bacterium]